MSNNRLALVSQNLPTVIVHKLENLGYGCVPIKEHPQLDTPVASHPDMIFSSLWDGTLITDGRYSEECNYLFELGIEISASSRSIGKKYPSDIVFDALVFDGTVYGYIDFIAPEILQNRKKAVFVKQGYTLCSTLVTDKVAVTADKGIFNALCENGVNALKINGDGIGLDGYGCGFIGGASVYEPLSDTVIFFGDITYHPDCKKILDFLYENGHSVYYFKGLPLKDYGGAKLLFDGKTKL